MESTKCSTSLTLFRATAITHIAAAMAWGDALHGFRVRFPSSSSSSSPSLRTLVLDPFGGSNVTGTAVEALGRRWVAADLDLGYISRSLGRVAGVPIRVTTGGLAAGLTTAAPVRAGDDATAAEINSETRHEDSREDQGSRGGSPRSGGCEEEGGPGRQMSLF
jgi:hypothetical protein